MSLLFEAVDTHLSTLTALANNVGIIFPQAKLVDMSAERINKVLSANVTGYFLCYQQAIKRMSTKTGGSGGPLLAFLLRQLDLLLPVNT